MKSQENISKLKVPSKSYNLTENLNLKRKIRYFSKLPQKT